MHVFQFPKRSHTAAAMFCLIVGLLYLAVFVQGTNRQNSLRVQAGRRETLTVNSGRPVAEAAWELEKKYGWVITYEDPIYVNSGEIVDVTTQVRRDLDHYKPGEAPRVFVPKGGELSISFNVNSDTGRPVEPPASVMLQILNANSAGGYPGQFRLKIDGLILHIIPTAYKDRSGALVPQQSVLDTVITIPSQERSGRQSLQLLCDVVSRMTQMKMDFGTFDPNLFSQSRNHVGVKREKARVFLVKLLESVNTYTRHSWRLLYDPTMRNYFLNIHPVPG